ncbi:a59f2995-1bf8-4302-a529-516135086104 [Sclerotinia trifoliorum]|uniref:A59f2995-1bf8-4302-a529-516135086104 n=1 Tax=Sclerotinia trifoliorum TaxID=28548 RepID=A0A8H2ZRB0_9HELO|nr:a59f2995-1bf8-4302-a529-516135086104 [Sclerotinia trifoliorum]
MINKMNATSSLHFPISTTMSPAFERFGHETIRSAAFLLIPTELLYFSIYSLLKRQYGTYKKLSALSLVTFCLSTWMNPISCGPVAALRNFAIGTGIFKILDIYTRHLSLPQLKNEPPTYKHALLLLTEMRYESFAPNFIPISRSQESFNEYLQFAIHIAIFCALQTLPQDWALVLAFEVELSIYITWTAIQLLVKYKSSPALFGKLYAVESLGDFWSKTWHNAYSAPCSSLAYKPLRQALPKLGVPVPIARSAGVLAAFLLMAAFHVYCLAPMLTEKALFRVGMFFILNGFATVGETVVWGRKESWMKTVLAWMTEMGLAAWTASALGIPRGINGIRWAELCEVRV